MDKILKHIVASAEVVDCLCVGTSIIMSLEAIHQAGLGKKVLMVDRAESFGGAWKAIEIDGIKGVENAIHYFTPDDKGIKFLKEELKWPVEKSRGKYRYFKFFGDRYAKFAYDSAIGRFLDHAFYTDRPQGFIAALRHFSGSLYKVVTEPRGASYYVADGAIGIINSLKGILSRYQIDIRFNANINKLYFDLGDRAVHCLIDDKKVICKSLILGHGARLPAIESTDGVLILDEKFHSRPAFHLVVEDDIEAVGLEIILTKDSLIKYVHDVSRFSSLGKRTNDKRKVFVFGLHSHIANSKELSGLLFKRLKDIGVVGQGSKVTASLYTDVILPTLYDEDLYILKDAMGDLVNVLRTENLSNGVGYYADKWKS
jgi:hypothetical protein